MFLPSKKGCRLIGFHQKGNVCLWRQKISCCLPSALQRKKLDGDRGAFSLRLLPRAGVPDCRNTGKIKSRYTCARYCCSNLQDTLLFESLAPLSCSVIVEDARITCRLARTRNSTLSAKNRYKHVLPRETHIAPPTGSICVPPWGNKAFKTPNPPYFLEAPPMDCITRQ